AKHCAYQLSCAFHLCSQRRGEVPLRKRHSGGCRADSFISAWLAATERNDRAQSARVSLARALDSSSVFPPLRSGAKREGDWRLWTRAKLICGRALVCPLIRPARPNPQALPIRGIIAPAAR